MARFEKWIDPKNCCSVFFSMDKIYDHLLQLQWWWLCELLSELMWYVLAHVMYILMLYISCILPRFVSIQVWIGCRTNFFGEIKVKKVKVQLSNSPKYSKLCSNKEQQAGDVLKVKIFPTINSKPTQWWHAWGDCENVLLILNPNPPSSCHTFKSHTVMYYPKQGVQDLVQGHWKYTWLGRKSSICWKDNFFENETRT